jgi:hypothetical protein
VIFSRTATSHDVLAWCLQNSGDPELASAGHTLKTLRKARNSADYDLDAPDFDNQRNINFHLHRAQEVATAIQAVSVDLVSAQIRHYASSILKLPLVER